MRLFRFCELGVIFSAIVYALGVPFDPSRLNRFADLPDDYKRKGLFFHMNQKVHHGRKLGHILIKIPVREVLTVAQQVITSVEETMEAGLDRGQATVLEPKLQRLMDNVHAFKPFRKTEQNQEFNPIHSRKKRSVKRSVKAKRLARKKRNAVQRSLHRLSRVKRGSWTINLDPTSMLNTLFSGIRSLLHAPSLKEIKQQLGKVTHLVKKQASFMSFVGKKTATALQLIKASRSEMKQHIGQVLMMIKITNVLDEALHSTDLLLTCLYSLAKGELCPMLNPAEILEALRELQLKADAEEGLKLLLSYANPLDLFALPATVMTMEDGSWQIAIHIPLVDHDDGFDGYQFVNAPFLNEESEPVAFKAEDGLLAIKGVLDVDKEHMFIPNHLYKEKCIKVISRLICSSVTIYRSNNGTCPASLMTNKVINGKMSPIACEMRPAEDFYEPVTIGSHMILFSLHDTQVEIDCPNVDSRSVTVSGRSVLNLSTGCQVKSSQWIATMPSVEGISVSLEKKDFYLLQVPISELFTKESTSESIIISGNATNSLIAQMDEELEDSQREIDQLEQSQNETRSTISELAEKVNELEDENEALKEARSDWDLGDYVSMAFSGFCFVFFVAVLQYLKNRAQAVVQR